MTVAEQVLERIPENATLGLGSGRAATAFIEALGQRVQQGFRVRGVPTSEASATLARRLGIPLITFDDVDQLDIDIDGADEVDPQLDLIKGLGGALVREKIVASTARQVFILVGPEKLVPILGSRGVLPVEVVPFALTPVSRRLTAMSCHPKLRLKDGKPFVTDNGNRILDCQIAPILDPLGFDAILHALPGVVDTGLFLGVASTVFIQHENRVEIRQRTAPRI